MQAWEGLGCAAQRPRASGWGLWVLESGTVSRLVMSDSLQPHGLYEAHLAPLSMGFSRQADWSGWPFPSPGDLPDPGLKLTSPALQADSFTI